jgi:hypothetical protein
MTGLSDLFSLIAEEKKNQKIRLEQKQIIMKAEQKILDSFSNLLENITKEDVTKSAPVETVEESQLEIVEQVLEEPKKELIEVSLGLIGGNTSTKTYDPLTPLDQKFVTFDDLQKHYKTYIDRIQQQLSTLGGGGEVNLRYLDDVNRGTMNPSNDNWVMEYDATTKKAQFTENIGPIKTLKLNTAGPDITTVPGMIAWNTAEDCMNIYQNDGTVLQNGLETYIRVHNHTGVPLLNGEVVRFGGVTADALGVPTARLMDADELQDPLFLIGVITADIANEETGRATTLGNVRGVNTTGSAVGETWAIGDILWVHPTLAGKMTNIKPTAPDLAVSVAAVMIVHATEGVLLVRPNFAPRLSYGTFLNTGDHVASAPNTPTNIPIDTVTKSRGFTLTGTTDSRITCSISGLYNFGVSYQITSTNASAKDIYFWIRRNGVDQPFTTRKQSITGNDVYQTFACNWTVSLTAGQYVQLMWAVSDVSVRLRHEDATAFAPSSPAVLLTVTEAAL